MNLRRSIVVLSVLTLVPSVASGSVESVKKHIEYLASDDLEGRMTGSDGERLAADYLARELKKLGAVPLPGLSGFRHEFEFTAGTKDTGSSLTVEGADEEQPHVWSGIEKVRALSFSSDGSVSGPLVFAGYGLETTESQSIGYDSYAGIDAKDKIVVVLRYWPEDVDDETRVVPMPVTTRRAASNPHTRPHCEARRPHYMNWAMRKGRSDVLTGRSSFGPQTLAIGRPKASSSQR